MRPELCSASDARRIAKEYLDKLVTSKYNAVEILDEATLTRNFGWVFFYQSVAYLRTREFTAKLVGNAPIIINRFTGELHVTGTAFPIHHYIAEYEAVQSRQA